MTPPHEPENVEPTRQAAPLEIGEKLRRKRESMGLSLEDAAKQLRVDIRHLRALESDDVAGLPSPVFTKGYLRNYARLLELDPDPLVSAFDASQTDLQPPPLSPITSVRASPRILGEFPWEKVLTLGGVLIAVLGVAWIGKTVYSLFKAASHEQSVMLPQPGDMSTGLPLTLDIPGAPSAENGGDLALPPEESGPVAPESDIETTAPELAVEPPAEPAPPPRPEATVTLHFGDDSWVELTDAVNTRLMSRVGKAGQTLSVSGIPPISVVLGNAPVVTVEYNGEPVEFRQPRRGQVAKFKLGE